MNPRDSGKRAAIEWRAFDDFEDLQEDPAALGLVRTFYLRTRGREFSSDDFRALELHRGMRDPSKAIGGFFSMIVRLGLAQRTGWIVSKVKSSHRRRIQTFAWTQAAREALGPGT